MDEGFFSGSLTYLCEHTQDGAMGIVINHPLDISVDEILEQLSLSVGQQKHGEVARGDDARERPSAEATFLDSCCKASAAVDGDDDEGEEPDAE